jgi:hypothetical protein
MGAAWERHGMCELALSVTFDRHEPKLNYCDNINKEQSLRAASKFTGSIRLVETKIN